MTDIIKQITILQKQNEGIIASLKSKNVIFDIETFDEILDDTIRLEKYKEVNTMLKELSKQNRPPPQESKPVSVSVTIPLAKKVSNNNDDDDEEQEIKEVKPVYSTITNMEEIKRTFFCKDYGQFFELINQYPFKYYKVNYKYASDNNGRPDYAARNLLRGFLQGLDDYRKYLMVCFRCILVDKEVKEYTYPSYWIVNSNDDIKSIMGTLYDDYEFILVDNEDEIRHFLKKIERTDEDEENDSLIGEVYLH